jgi:hypothetical protein
LILGGLLTQNAQTYDRFVSADFTNFLFKETEHDFGADLVARNIQVRTKALNFLPHNCGSSKIHFISYYSEAEIMVSRITMSSDSCAAWSHYPLGIKYQKKFFRRHGKSFSSCMKPLTILNSFLEE